MRRVAKRRGIVPNEDSGSVITDSNGESTMTVDDEIKAELSPLVVRHLKRAGGAFEPQKDDQSRLVLKVPLSEPDLARRIGEVVGQPAQPGPKRWRVTFPRDRAGQIRRDVDIVARLMHLDPAIEQRVNEVDMLLSFGPALPAALRDGLRNLARTLLPRKGPSGLIPGLPPEVITYGRERDALGHVLPELVEARRRLMEKAGHLPAGADASSSAAAVQSTENDSWCATQGTMAAILTLELGLRVLFTVLSPLASDHGIDVPDAAEQMGDWAAYEIKGFESVHTLFPGDALVWGNLSGGAGSWVSNSAGLRCWLDPRTCVPLLVGKLDALAEVGGAVASLAQAGLRTITACALNNDDLEQCVRSGIERARLFGGGLSILSLSYGQQLRDKINEA